ncbi:MAG: polysaccharide biosynthesis C-terminal domain-containing protein [Chitinophagaceae bacterium]|nr:polysaccharide biosynthesis C-terminal domain-containing protein [Chitinophagaceae bacterium]
MKLHIQFNVLFLCKLALFLSNFLILYILSNFYAANVAGEFYYQISILSIIAMFSNIGIDNSIFYFLKKGVFTTSNILAISFKIVFFFVLLATAAWVSFYLFSDNRYPIIFSLLFICSLLLQYIFNAHFLAIKKGWIPQIGLTVINIIFITWLLLNQLPLKNKYGELLNIYYSLFFLTSFVVLLYIFFTTPKYRIEQPSKDKLRLLLKFGLFPYITNSLFFLGANIDLIVVKKYCEGDLSAYVQATKIFQIFCSVFYLLYYPFMGQIIEANHKEGVKILMRSSRIISFILVLIIIPFLLICSLFLDKIFPSSYDQVMMLLKYLGISFFSTSLAYFYTSYFVANKMHKQNIISASVFLITIVFLSFLLIPALGIKGGAIAYSISILCSLIFDIILFKIKNNVKFSDTLLIKKEDMLFIKNYFN